jgi:hypothetical protein
MPILKRLKEALKHEKEALEKYLKLAKEELDEDLKLMYKESADISGTRGKLFEDRIKKIEKEREKSDEGDK